MMENKGDTHEHTGSELAEAMWIDMTDRPISSAPLVWLQTKNENDLGAIITRAMTPDLAEKKQRFNEFIKQQNKQKQ